MAAHDWLGRAAVGADGRPLGPLDEVFVGRSGGRPQFGIVTVDDPGGAAAKQVAVPLQDAERVGEDVRLAVAADRVLAAPAVGRPLDVIPPEAGREILEFFGIDATTPLAPAAATGAEPPASAEADTTTPIAPVAGAPAAGPGDAPAEIVRAEEQLTVDTRPRAAERVRIRKEVVTEEVTITVSLSREQLVIEREPVDGDAVGLPGADAPLGEGGELVVVLHAEEPVIDKRVVPVERIRLRRDTVVEEQRIVEQLRKERVDVEETPIEEEPRP